MVVDAGGSQVFARSGHAEESERVRRAGLPIGMFDSGVGGLTVARAVMDLLPHEDLVYFGDIARCPYGPRSEEEVRRFTLQIMDRLIAEEVKLIVIACNTAASSALELARSRYEVPVISVIEPGIRAAITSTRNRRIGLIGTERTVAAGGYDEALLKTRVNVSLHSAACPRFVEFVERGDTTSDEVVAAAETYLAPLKDAGIDTLILGCTHYPFLSGVIQYVMGEDVVLVSSADVTATEVFAKLKQDDLLDPKGEPGVHRFLASSEDGSLGALATSLLGPRFGGIEHEPWPS